MTGGGLGIADLADIEPLDHRGRGEFFAATDLKLDRRVAIRLLPAVVDDRERSRFEHESRVLGLLSSHPNVVTVFDAGFTATGRPFLVLELVDGTDLAQLLEQRGPLPWQEALDITLQLCSGLIEAHRSGTLHGDLRPENVLVSGQSVKLSDLGLLSFDPGDGVDPELDQLLHRAPEAVDGVRDERTDLYSLASILYQLIDGRPPFWRPADTVETLRTRVATEAVPPLDPDDVPQQVRVFITAALSKDPLDRPQTAEEFARELDLIRRGRTTGSTPSVLHGSTVTLPVMAGPVPDGRAGQPEPTMAAARIEIHPPVADPPATSPVPAGSTVPTVASAALATPGPPGGLDGPVTWTQPAGPPPEPPGPSMPPAPSIASARSMAPLPAMAAAPPTALEPSTAVGRWAPPATITAERGDLPPSPGGTAIHPVQSPPDRTAVHQTVGAPTIGQADWGWSGYPADPSTELAPTPGPAAPPLLETMDPVRRNPFGEDHSPAFLAAVAMMALGLIGLIGVAAYGLLSSGDEGSETAAPALPGEGETVAGDGSESGSSTTLTPLAMLPSSTTTLAPEDMESTSTTKPQVTVPDLVGSNVETAGGILADAGFQVLVVGRVSPGAIPGTVIQQVPAAGSVSTLPLTVTLYIPRSSTMPAVVGRPADTVCLQLSALGLTCEQTMQFDDQVAAGAVISSDPVEGAGFNEGQTVRLQVSRGPRVVLAIPEVGRRSEEDARAILTDAGFLTIATLAQPSESVPAGQSIGTTPAAGSTVAIDEPVTILISSGPAPRVTVPDLIGVDRATAEARLAEVGLTGTFLTSDLPAGDPGIGKVVAADPSQGTEVLAGTAVTVTIGQQATTSTTVAE